MCTHVQLNNLPLNLMQSSKCTAKVLSDGTRSSRQFNSPLNIPIIQNKVIKRNIRSKFNYASLHILQYK